MVVHEMNRGGIENFIMNLYRVIDREVIQFDFVVHTNKKCDFDDEIESLGGTIYHCPDYRIINQLGYSNWWNKFFKEHKEYHIVHSHLDSCANIHLRIAKKYGCKTIAHSHSSAEGTGIRSVVKKILKIGFNSCSDYKFACSRLAAEWLFKNEADKATIVNNGIIVNNYHFDENKRAIIRGEFGISTNEFVVGNIGRVDQNKNQGFIIEIIKCLNDNGISSTFICAGTGIKMDDYKQKAIDLGIENKVKFLGLRSDVSDVLQGFDVFVMPSVYEGLPVSSIEAQASGLRCFLSDTISKECNITGNVSFLSLEKSANEWAKEISNYIVYERTTYDNEIAKAGYDIITTANYLTDFYQSIS